MDLERAMLLVAGTLPRVSGRGLAQAVRTALLDALAGRLPARLPPHESRALKTWLEGQQPDQLYQEMLGRAAFRDESGALRVERQRQVHRATGAYYTGEIVVRYLLDRAQAYLPDASSLIDPACGAGSFLEMARGRYARLVGLDTDPAALSVCRRRVPEAELHALDALTVPFSGGFDLCLGNPPYISSGLRGAPAQSMARQAELRLRYPQTAQYKLNTYPLFIERGLELLRDGGVLGFILPDSFLSGHYFAGIRRLLLSQTILELTLIREDFWEHGRVGQSVILMVRKAPPPSDYLIRVKVCRQVSDLPTASDTLIPRKEVVWGALDRFRLLPDPAVRKWVGQMESLPESQPLGRFLTPYSGLIGRSGQASLLRSVNPHLAGPWGRLLRSGREIDRYRLSWAGEEVCLDPALIKSGGNLAYYRNPKLLLRQTADSLRAVYDDQGYYCLNNIHLLVPTGEDGANLLALLGLINSGPVNRYYRALTMEAGRLYPQVDLDLLAGIPVPKIAPEDRVRLERLVQARSKAAPDGAALLEREIDELVGRLYGCAVGTEPA